LQVICDAYTPAGVAIPTNKRAYAAEVFSDPKVIEEEPWCSLELKTIRISKIYACIMYTDIWLSMQVRA
jgi:glutamine synthetase